MFKYAQIDDTGIVEGVLETQAEITAENMILIDDGLYITNKKYVDGEWVEYILESTPEPEPTDEEIIQAQILLNQADILARQNEQDEVLAAILLNQVEV